VRCMNRGAPDAGGDAGEIYNAMSKNGFWFKIKADAGCNTQIGPEDFFRRPVNKRFVGTAAARAPVFALTI
jgi:hypothetical protein